MNRSELRARCQNRETKHNPEATVLVDAREVIAVLDRLEAAEALLREVEVWDGIAGSSSWDRIRAFLEDTR